MVNRMAREIVKKVANCVLYSDGCIRIDRIRLSYPHLSEPWGKNEGDKKKYSATGLALKETHEEAKKLIVEEINKLLVSSKIGKLASEHKFIKNGDDSGKDEAEGMWIIKASENPDKPPALRNRKGALMTPVQAAPIFTAGVLVNILLRPWAQNNQHGKKINANLIGVQFVEDDGTRYGEGSVDDEGAWDPLDDIDESADMSLDDDDDL